MFHLCFKGHTGKLKGVLKPLLGCFEGSLKYDFILPEAFTEGRLCSQETLIIKQGRCGNGKWFLM